MEEERNIFNAVTRPNGRNFERSLGGEDDQGVTKFVWLDVEQKIQYARPPFSSTPASAVAHCA